MEIKSIDSVKTTSDRACTCEVCGIFFESKTNKPAIYCSTKCRRIGSNEKTRLKNQEEFLKLHGNDPLMPICKECGWKAFDLITHITKFHKMPMAEYYAKHNCTVKDVFHPNQYKERQERVSGEKNPGYQHGGTMSSLSPNFKKYDGLTDDEKALKIESVKKKQHQQRELNNGYTTRVSYWLSRGFDIDEAIIKVKERQTTFSLEICVEKLGEIEGHKRWNERQQKWLHNLYSKLTKEEIDELNARKTFAIKNGFSKVALSLFNELEHPLAIFATESCTEEYMIQTVNGKSLSVDYILGNNIIEFYGDAYHANPIIYQGTEQPTYLREITSEQIWARDAAKQQMIRDSGYKLLVVWEHDFKWKREETIKKCREFLGLD